MKIRPLPETDLARIAPLPTSLKRKALEQLRIGRPPYRYAPVRKSLPDILNIRADLFGVMPRVPFSKIAETIRLGSVSDDEEVANLRVAEGLYDHATTHGMHGRKQDFFPLALGLGEKVVFWHSLVLVTGERPLVPFIDPRRRTKSLTAEARRFVFSMMHERIRVADPDFTNVALGIYQFSTPEKGPRVPVLYTDETVTLFTLDDLEDMVRETYALWHEVCAQRTAEVRRRHAGGGSDSMI